MPNKLFLVEKNGGEYVELRSSTSGRLFGIYYPDTLSLDIRRSGETVTLPIADLISSRGALASVMVNQIETSRYCAYLLANLEIDKNLREEVFRLHGEGKIALEAAKLIQSRLTFHMDEQIVLDYCQPIVYHYIGVHLWPKDGA